MVRGSGFLDFFRLFGFFFEVIVRGFFIFLGFIRVVLFRVWVVDS